MIFEGIDESEIENVYPGDTVHLKGDTFHLKVSKQNFISILLQRANNIGCKLIMVSLDEFHFKDSRFLERQSNINEILS